LKLASSVTVYVTCGSFSKSSREMYCVIPGSPPVSPLISRSSDDCLRSQRLIPNAWSSAFDFSRRLFSAPPTRIALKNSEHTHHNATPGIFCIAHPNSDLFSHFSETGRCDFAFRRRQEDRRYGNSIHHVQAFEPLGVLDFARSAVNPKSKAGS
jgi:hypothetical protein